MNTMLLENFVDLATDCYRRDLSINSMAMTENGQLIDPYGGQRDIENKVLRHTSQAFSEDPLRVIRLARFAARYENFKIASETLDLCRKMTSTGELDALSHERIWAELERGLKEGDPSRFVQVLVDTGAVANSAMLRKLFSPSIKEKDLQAFKYLNELEPHDKFIIGVSLLAVNGTETPNAPIQVQKLIKNFRALIKAERTAVSLMSLLQQIGALREGTEFGDLCKLCVIKERVERLCSFSSRDLIIAKSVVSNVNARMFPPEQFQGEALGKAIKDLRIAELQAAFNF